MKALYFTLWLLIAAIFPQGIYALDMKPVRILIEQQERQVVYYGFRFARVDFDRAVLLAQKEVRPVVMCDGETVSVGEVSDITDNEVTLYFGDMFVATKGKSYRLVIEAGAFRDKDNADCVSDEIVKDFKAAEAIPCSHIQVGNNDDGEYDKASRIGFYFGTEVMAFDGAEILCYANGVLETRYKAYSSWDWDIGLAYANIDDATSATKKFYKGIHYEFVLPKGSVHHIYDKELVNNEARIEFDGEYEDATAINAAEHNKDELEADCVGNTLMVRGLVKSTEVAVFDMEGRTVARKMATDGSATIDLPAKGVYILRADGKAEKVMCR